MTRLSPPPPRDNNNVCAHVPPIGCWLRPNTRPSPQVLVPVCSLAVSPPELLSRLYPACFLENPLLCRGADVRRLMNFFFLQASTPPHPHPPLIHPWKCFARSKLIHMWFFETHTVRRDGFQGLDKYLIFQSQTTPNQQNHKKKRLTEEKKKKHI